MLGYLRKNKVGRLREFNLNLISKSVCALASNLLSSQKFEHEMWHKMKTKKICTDMKIKSRFLSFFIN